MEVKSKYNIKDFLEKKINKWTVISFSHIDKKGQQHWLCRCECGLEKPVRTSNLIRELNKGCRYCRGQATSGEMSPYWKGYKEISGQYINKLKYRNRIIPISISIKDLYDKWIDQKGICIYSGLKLKLCNKDTKWSESTASIDRIDSSKGYEKGNVQWVHKRINTMKNDMTELEFLSFCCLVAGNCVS